MRVLARAQVEHHGLTLPGGQPQGKTCYERGVDVGRAWSTAKGSLAEMRQRQREGMGPRENRELLAEFEEDVDILRVMLKAVPAECDPDEKGRQLGYKEVDEAMKFASEGQYISADDALNGAIK